MPKSHRYPEVEANPDFPKLEEKILKHWQDSHAFEKSVSNRPERTADGKSNRYVFYDGPPFANGLPHYGHLLTGYVKDAIARYQTMNGKRVERRFGWDCHGLPAEMGAEKDLGITGRASIIQYGIDKFNAHCRESVMKYRDEWRYYVNRQGRWVDFDNDYKTMDTNFMESVLWAFKQLYDKGLVYESMRVMPYSWAAETPLSNFETRLDNATREREDKAAYVTFKLKEKPKGAPDAANYYIVAWTTTPWTLPSNLALAVNPGMDYACIVKSGSCFIQAVWAKEFYTELETEAQTQIKGKDLVGLTYEPLFPYFEDTKNAFRVLDGGDMVTEGEGTGIVHMAPGFGEIDQKICADNGIEVVVPVDEKGRYMEDIFDLPDLTLRGLNVIADRRLEEGDKANHISEKDVEKFGLANMRIVRWLKKHGKLVKDEPYKHNYPHCWRTDQPLIYRAMPSWYVAVTKFRDRAGELNKRIDWTPEHIRDGQMGHMLATAPDWSISRNRFWGTPIPIWRSKSGKIKVFGSIAEIEKASGQKIADLHRPMIDEIVIHEGGESYHRVEDVFDCWFESGSMPFAQLHYPFENQKQFEENFPADFITEYVGQTRGWFNTLIMLATAIFDKEPFEHCICHGVVLDAETGLKYSKRLKNYKDPKEVMDQFGADALRWLMLSSPVMRGADLSVDPEGKFIRDVVRLAIKPIWNAYNFFTLYANADGVEAKPVTTSENILDRYILAKCKAAVEQVKASLDAYDTPGATDAITGFFEILNNWYIRRSRPRFWGEEVTADKQSAYNTLFTVLNAMVTAAAPLLPFTTEAIWQGLNRTADSVHWQDFPDVSGIAEQSDLIVQMDWAREVCTAALAIRSKKNIRVRQPLSMLNIYGSIPMLLEHVKGGSENLVLDWNQLHDMICEEVNVKAIQSHNSPEEFESVASRKLVINAQVLGKLLPQKMKQILPASKKGEWVYEQGVGVKVAGELLKATDGTYNIVLEPKPEYKDSAEVAGEVVVVLDLTITPELEAEGLARDLVRMIQQARKDAGLDVSDRIALNVQIPASFQPALKHAEYIKTQTLAVSLAEGKGTSGKEITSELDGETFVIGITKAAA